MLSGFTPKEREYKLDDDTGKERVHAWSQSIGATNDGNPLWAPGSDYL